MKLPHAHIDPDGLEEFSVVFTDRSLNHMSAKFQGVMRDVSGLLKEVYNGTAVALVPGGGTYAMEAVARQFGQGHALIVRISDEYYALPLPTVEGVVRIAREEIFGPVLSILGYENVDQAIQIGNDTEYGLAAYVQAADLDAARKVASKLRAGQVSINGGGGDMMAPFGGYKMSGNGREWGDFAFHEFLETKAVLGYAPKAAAE